jgi:rsbT co-antagonist protein RsbR
MGGIRQRSARAGRQLAGIREHRARVVILDITGVPIVDSGVAAYLNKTIQAARLKGAQAIITGMSDAVAETIVDLGVDWSSIETLSDLQTGLRFAMAMMARRPKASGKDSE